MSSQASQTINVVDESPRDLHSEKFADEANLVRASDRWTRLQYLSFCFDQISTRDAHIGGSKGGARDASPLGVQILSFSCSFWQKNWKIIALLGVGAPLGKILDPPLAQSRTIYVWWQNIKHDSLFSCVCESALPGWNVTRYITGVYNVHVRDKSRFKKRYKIIVFHSLFSGA